jgi:hypothetical protein
MTWGNIWLKIGEYLWKVLTTPKGGESASIDLGSGYSKEEDRAMKKEELESLLHDIVQDSDLFQDSADHHTHCNIAIARACEHFGYEWPKDTSGDYPLANAMIQIMIENGDRWILDDSDRAVAHAMKGGLAIAAKEYAEHGHVASIAPRPMEMSGSLGHEVPIVANVGRGSSKFCKVSEAFPPAEGEPRYFLLDVKDIS